MSFPVLSIFAMLSNEYLVRILLFVKLMCEENTEDFIYGENDGTINYF
jgi:hypothetical protein